jgi:hypothetical protein
MSWKNQERLSNEQNGMVAGMKQEIRKKHWQCSIKKLLAPAVGIDIESEQINHPMNNG